MSGNVHRTYDNFFRLATETVNGANPVTYGYDADGLVTSVGAMTLSPSLVNGLLTGTTLSGVTDSYTYDAYGQIATYTAKFGATVLYSYSIDQRDALGRIAQKTETIQGVTHVYQYGYSSRGWLTDVSTDGQVTGHYEYDANGNRTSLTQNGVTQSAYFDDQDRLLAQGTLQFTYTANGEVRTKTDTATGEVTTYAYDALGNLRDVVLPDGREITYVIDAQNRRVGRRVNAIPTQGWLYHGGAHFVAELDGTGNITTRMAYSPRHGGHYLVHDTHTYRVITDHLSSPRILVDVASGVIARTINYDVFGVVVTDSAQDLGAIGFAGGLYDPGTQLVRFMARDYDAAFGRWTAKDPIRFRGRASNLFSYADSDPINRVDRSGLKTWVCNKPIEGASWFNHQYLCYQFADEDDIHCWGLGGNHALEQYYADSCVEKYDDDGCIEMCVEDAIDDPNKPEYNVFTNNCFEWSVETLYKCADVCWLPGPGMYKQ